MLHGSWNTITQLRSDVKAGHQLNSDLVQSYSDMYDKYNKKSKELHELNTKYYSLYEDWEQSQKLVREYDSTVKRYLIANDDSQCEADPKHIIAELEIKIIQLEEEKLDIVKRHRSALAAAADRIGAADQRMKEATEQAQAFLVSIETGSQLPAID